MSKGITKYAIGDKVLTTSTWTDYMDSFGHMKLFLNKVVTIESIDEYDGSLLNYHMAECPRWYWGDDMIVGLAEPKYKVGDRVIIVSEPTVTMVSNMLDFLGKEMTIEKTFIINDAMNMTEDPVKWNWYPHDIAGFAPKETVSPVYKVGDRVTIVSDRGTGMNSGGAMDKYLGTVMTISKVHISGGFDMLEDVGRWYWSKRDIVGLAPEGISLEEMITALKADNTKQFSSLKALASESTGGTSLVKVNAEGAIVWANGMYEGEYVPIMAIPTATRWVQYTEPEPVPEPVKEPTTSEIATLTSRDNAVELDRDGDCPLCYWTPENGARFCACCGQRLED